MDRRHSRRAGIVILVAAIACGGSAAASAERGAAAVPSGASARVAPGITVLLEDSLNLIAGKRVGLLTNQTGVDEHGTSDIDLLYRFTKEDRLVTKEDRPGPRLVALFSPEHGIRGTEDRLNLASARDARTGLPIYSLYGATVLGPPDSTLRGLDVLVIDLQDLGARPWTYVASMVYAMRSAARNRLPVLVLDRPNPITGEHVEGPLLDSGIAYAGSHSAARPANPTGLYPIPERHGLTMGELARFYNDVLGLHADLHVIPMRNWHRTMWFDETHLPWVKPSPNMPNLTSATLYPGMVWLEALNVSVGRGTDIPFQRFGAPWLDAKRAADLLNDRELAGLRFEAERFTPVNPTDQKYGGRSIPGVRVVITDREKVRATRLGAAVIWAMAKVAPDSLRIRIDSFDKLVGVPSARAALLAGADPDSIIDASLPATIAFRQRVTPYLLYR